jgi:hypothetical protein
VLNSKKSIDDNGLFYKRYEESCGSWNSKNDEIVSVLSESKRINGIDYHNDFDILPRQMEGLGLTEDSTTFQYRINAGSEIVILMKDIFFTLATMVLKSTLFWKQTARQLPHISTVAYRGGVTYIFVEARH